ncbi:HIT family protein [Natrarchaeobius sp. A-rgal3]|uniref:HIT family protein n=1 Tax=Natrarchaeobius versutus TaxID=1679078 RepID=UPI003510A71E
MAKSDECVFYEIIAGEREADVLLESEAHLCFVDAYPVNEGHALVVPKDHVQYLENASDEGMFEFLKTTLEAVNDRYEPDSTTVGVNNGPEAGQTIPHLYWYIIPRYEGDVDSPTGGVRGAISEKRTY